MKIVPFPFQYASDAFAKWMDASGVAMGDHAQRMEETLNHVDEMLGIFGLQIIRYDFAGDDIFFGIGPK